MLVATAARAEWPIPTADGTIWQYVLTREGEDRPGTLTRQVFAAKTPAEQNVLRIETAVNGATHSTEFLKNEGKTILATAFRNANGETQTFDPPATVLPGDLNFGAEWNYRGAVAGLDLDLPLKIIGEGEIEVPAGKFHALHFRGEKNDGLFTVADFWFVRGVGSIKEVVTQRGPSGDLLSRNSIELAKLPALSQTKPELKNWRPRFPPAAMVIRSTWFPPTPCRSWHVGAVMGFGKMQGSARFGSRRTPASHRSILKLTKQPPLLPSATPSVSSPFPARPTAGRPENIASSFMSTMNLPTRLI